MTITILKEFFDKFVIQVKPEVDLPIDEFFKGWLWFKGFKIVPNHWQYNEQDAEVNKKEEVMPNTLA